MSFNYLIDTLIWQLKELKSVDIDKFKTPDEFVDYLENTLSFDEGVIDLVLFEHKNEVVESLKIFLKERIKSRLEAEKEYVETNARLVEKLAKDVEEVTAGVK